MTDTLSYYDAVRKLQEAAATAYSVARDFADDFPTHTGKNGRSPFAIVVQQEAAGLSSAARLLMDFVAFVRLDEPAAASHAATVLSDKPSDFDYEILRLHLKHPEVGPFEAIDAMLAAAIAIAHSVGASRFSVAHVFEQLWQEFHNSLAEVVKPS